VEAVQVGGASLRVVRTHGVTSDRLLFRTQVDGRVKAVYALRLDTLLV
jgi:hypothetical protein